MITVKQINYIRYLLAKNNLNISYDLDTLTKKQGSILIRELLDKEDHKETIAQLNLAQNIKYLKRAGLIPSFIKKDNITHQQISKIESNLTLISQRIIEVLEIEMQSIEDILVEKKTDEYAIDRMRRLNARLDFITRIRDKGILGVNIKGINKKLAAYTAQIFKRKVNLLDKDIKEDLNDIELEIIYI